MTDKPRGAIAAKGMATPAKKTTMHSLNPHRDRYDFKRLIAGSTRRAQ